MKEIKLTKGQVALVDDVDYEFINKWKWCAVKNKFQQTYRAQRRAIIEGKSTTIAMHSLILQRKLGVRTLMATTDHKDGNGLNNRRSNLRSATYSQNCANVGKKRKNATSQYKGVFFEKSCNRWRAKIKHHYKDISLGCYKTEKEAAIAYNTAAIALYGEFAFLNQIH